MDSGLRVALQQRISHKSFPLVEPQQLEVVDPQRFSTVTFTRVSYQSPNADRDTGRAWRIVAWEREARSQGCFSSVTFGHTALRKEV